MKLGFNSRKSPVTTARRIGSSFHSAVDEIADAAKPVVDRAASTAHDALDTAISAADAAAGWLGEQGETVTAAQRRLVARTTRYVTAHPLKTAALFFVAGVIFAKLMR